MRNDDETRRYVERHFLTIDELAEVTGCACEHALKLIAAGCAPGAIYIYGPEGWWSALDRDVRPMPKGEIWFSAGAAWPLRRAILAERSGSTPTEAAELLENAFVEAFVIELGRAANAVCAFPECFAGDAIDVPVAKQVGKREWANWIDGGYGVCLRVFTGETCVSKETWAATIKAAFAAGDYDVVHVLAEVERLANLILPFAPWQRLNGTPGKTIDRFLKEQGLGSDQLRRKS